MAFVLGYPAEPGVLTGVAGLDRLADMLGTPAWYPVKRIGDPVEHLTDSRGYAGIVYAEAETAEPATHRAVAAANALRVLTEPFPGPARRRTAGAVRPSAPVSEERSISWSSPRRETGSRCESGTVPPL